MKLVRPYISYSKHSRMIQSYQKMRETLLQQSKSGTQEDREVTIYMVEQIENEIEFWQKNEGEV